MESEETKEEKYLNHLINLIWNFIAKESYELSKQILPEKERDNLANISLFQTDSKVIYDYFYVIDRFCNAKIFPKEYEIKYSTEFNKDKLTDEESENLDLIISILQSKNHEKFTELNRFYPKSSISYIRKPYGSSEYRYNVDFSGSIWGIKHLHLKESSREDNVLYYVLIDNIIYFIRIGSHDEMYKKNNVEVLINEFQHILPQLGIGNYPDMPFENFENLSVDKVKQNWTDGKNVGLFINDKLYVSTNLMTGSKIKAKLNHEILNISYQIENQSKEFIQSLINEKKDNNDLEIWLDGYKDLSKNELLIKEETLKIALFFNINYLTILNQVRILVETYSN